MVARGGCLSLPLVADRLVGNRPMSGGEIDALAATACGLLVALALAGCAQGISGQAGAPSPPYTQEDIRPEHGGGGGL